MLEPEVKLLTVPKYIQLAIKTLKYTNEQHYRNEIDAFSHLEKNQNMISFLGEFQYVESPAHTINLDGIEHVLERYNIVLEPVVCDLNTYLWQADIPIHRT